MSTKELSRMRITIVGDRGRIAFAGTAPDLLEVGRVAHDLVELAAQKISGAVQAAKELAGDDPAKAAAFVHYMDLIREWRSK